MKNSTFLSFTAPNEPDPKTWLCPERREQLLELTNTVKPLLLQAGLWRATLGYWVRDQVSREASWGTNDEESELKALEEHWRAKTPIENQNLSAEIIRAKLRVAPAAARWSREQWSHRLDSLFLESKEKLDRASAD